MTRAQGVDLSFWDLSFDPDKATKPIDFAIQRVSLGLKSGGIARDSALDVLYPGVAKVGIFGAYHYYSTHSPWRTQADFFLETVRDRGYQFYALDFEEKHNDLSISSAQNADFWMQYVAQETKKPVILYTSPSLYDEFAWHYCSKWPLWLAQYYLNNPSPDKQPALPKKRKAGDWTIWQWASEVNYPGHAREYGCGANSVDLNVFYGTVADMRAWLGLDVTPEPIPPVPVPPAPPVVTGKLYKVVTAGGLCVRSAPSLDAPRVRTMKQGDLFRVVGAQESGEYTWLELADVTFAAEKRVVKTVTTFAEKQ